MATSTPMSTPSNMNANTNRPATNTNANRPNANRTP
jgi:hypothetical protein